MFDLRYLRYIAWYPIAMGVGSCFRLASIDSDSNCFGLVVIAFCLCKLPEPCQEFSPPNGQIIIRASPKPPKFPQGPSQSGWEKRKIKQISRRSHLNFRQNQRQAEFSDTMKTWPQVLHTLCSRIFSATEFEGLCGTPFDSASVLITERV